MMPGVIEAGAFVANTLVGIWGTIVSRKIEAAEAQNERMLKLATAQQQATDAARNVEESLAEGSRRITVKRKLFGFEWSYDRREDGFVSKTNSGFHLTRRIIALTVVFSYFLLPVLLVAFMPDVSFAYGYADTVSGFFGGEHQEVKWFVLGNGSRTIFYPPFLSFTLSSIMGLFFGNQISKR